MRDPVHTLKGLGTEVPNCWGGTWSGSEEGPSVRSGGSAWPDAVASSESARSRPNYGASVDPPFAPRAVDEAQRWEDQLRRDGAHMHWLPVVAVGLGAVGLLALIMAAFVPSEKALGLSRDGSALMGITPLVSRAGTRAEQATHLPRVQPAPARAAAQTKATVNKKQAPAKANVARGARPSTAKATPTPKATTKATARTKNAAAPARAGKGGAQKPTDLYGLR